MKRKSRKAYFYLAPALVSILIFTVMPIAATIYYAFTDYNLYSKGNVNLVGIKNFIEVLNGPFKQTFLPVFSWTMIFAVVSTLGCFFLGLIIALVLNNKNMKERGFYKGILIIPWALPAAVAILSFQGLLNGSYGQVNNFLMSINLIKEPIKWLTDPTLARISVLMVNVWLGFPYMMNVCLGSLAAIPEVYYEAAEVDGASKWKQFTSITLPSLAKTAYPLIISSFAFNFNNFGSAYLITQGNPARLDTQFAGYTDILASVNYKLSIQFGRYDIASALSIIIFLIIASISFVQMKASGQFEEVD
jgi:arabinogalactan oligomer/maltooligosaccharide transport system permease protein